MGLTSEGDEGRRMLLPSLRGTAWAPAAGLRAFDVLVRAGGELERDKEASESAGGLACSIAGLQNKIQTSHCQDVRGGLTTVSRQPLWHHSASCLSCQSRQVCDGSCASSLCWC
jgi:hypothetical protein